MTAIATFVGASAVDNGIATNSDCVLTFPAGAVAGDVAVIFASWNNANAINTPTGWSLVDSATVTTVLSTAVFMKTLGAGEGGTTVTINHTSGGRSAGGIIVYHTVDLSQAPTEEPADANSSTQDIGSITPSGSDAKIFALVASNVQGGVSAYTPPTGWTERADAVTDHTSGNRVGAAIFTKDADVASGAASGATTTAFVGANGRGTSYTFAAKNGSVPVVTGWSLGTILMGS